MKQLFHRLAWLAARLAAIVGACLGCTAPQEPDIPQPRKTHWRGHETGYTTPSSNPQSKSAAEEDPTP